MDQEAMRDLSAAMRRRRPVLSCRIATRAGAEEQTMPLSLIDGSQCKVARVAGVAHSVGVVAPGAA
jgi:hypothetical protein